MTYETKTYVKCSGCLCNFNDYFKSFKMCPLCKGKLFVTTLVGENMPDALPLKWFGDSSIAHG